MKLSCSVMAHQSRAHLVPELVDRLGITDDQVAWDRKGDRWDTGRRAWEAHDPTATHHLVVQDDAIVCRDLIPGLEAALEYVPDEAVTCPYVGTRRPVSEQVERATVEAGKRQASWIVMKGLNWGVGVLVPVPAIEPMLAYGDRQRYPNYDRRIGRFFVRMCWPTWCTWPALVDHRDDIPSLCGHGDGRVARSFLGEDKSALDIDWAAEVVVMSRSPRSPLRSFPDGQNIRMNHDPFRSRRAHRVQAIPPAATPVAMEPVPDVIDDGVTVDGLRPRAEQLGIKVDGRSTVPSLQRKIADAEARQRETEGVSER